MFTQCLEDIEISIVMTSRAGNKHVERFRSYLHLRLEQNFCLKVFRLYSRDI